MCTVWVSVCLMKKPAVQVFISQVFEEIKVYVYLFVVSVFIMWSYTMQVIHHNHVIALMLCCGL